MERCTDVLLCHDVAHVNGGSGMVALAYARGLAGRGLNVTLLAGRGPVDDDLTKAGVRVICLDQPDILENWQRFGSVAQGLWNRKSEAACADILRSLPRDSTVVHVHSWSRVLSASIFRAVRAAGYRCLAHIHDYFLVCPNGGLLDYPRSRPCGKEPMSVGCLSCACDSRSNAHKAYRVARHCLHKTVFRTNDAIHGVVCHLPAITDLLRPLLPPHIRFFEAPICVDIPPARKIDAASNERFVMVGRLQAEKGPDLLARAAAVLGLSPLFIGDGPMRNAIKELCPAAEVTGWLPPHEVRARLAQARALVFPSRWYETYGLVVAEALSLGVPAIVSDVVPISRRIAKARSGLAFAGGDWEDLALCLAEANDDQLIRKLGAYAHAAHLSEPLSVDAGCQAMAQIYDDILS